MQSNNNNHVREHAKAAAHHATEAVAGIGSAIKNSILRVNSTQKDTIASISSAIKDSLNRQASTPEEKIAGQLRREEIIAEKNVRRAVSGAAAGSAVRNVICNVTKRSGGFVAGLRGKMPSDAVRYAENLKEGKPSQQQDNTDNTL